MPLPRFRDGQCSLRTLPLETKAAMTLDDNLLAAALECLIARHW